MELIKKTPSINKAMDQGHSEGVLSTPLVSDSEGYDYKRFCESFMKSSIIKNEKALELDYVPSTLLHRNEVISYLSSIYQHILTDKTLSQSTLLIGPGGIGKSCTARFFMKYLYQIVIDSRSFPQFHCLYLNCVEYKTKNKILRKIYSDLKKYFSGRGFDDIELMIEILQTLKNEDSYLFLVLDEIHLLPNTDIMQLLSISETFGHHNVRISILLLTRHYDWARLETERILSRLNNYLMLAPYTYEAIFDIINQRAELTLYNTAFDNNCIGAIATIAYNSQNIRLGLDILRNSAVHTDKNREGYITLETINKFSKNRFAEFRHIIDILPAQSQLVLYSILKTKEGADIGSLLTIDQAYSYYVSTNLAYNKKPHILMVFRKHIRDLKNSRLINTHSEKKAEGRGRYLVIDVDKELDIKGILVHLEDLFELKYKEEL